MTIAKAKKPTSKPAAAKPAPVKRSRTFKPGIARAMHATSKSGYAKDIPGAALEPAEREGGAVPVATEGGRQEGRVPPAKRLYGVAKYAVVDATQAQANMMKRIRGELPLIAGGLDYNIAADETEGTMDDNFDPLGDSVELEPGSPELEQEERKLAQATRRPPFQPKYTEAMNAPAAVPSATQEFLDKRCRVTLELADGAMSMSAITVKESRYGLTILLPLLSDGATFIPKPGSEITVVYGDKRWPCFFPGTYFECPELKLLGIVFVKAEES